MGIKYETLNDLVINLWIPWIWHL